MSVLMYSMTLPPFIKALTNLKVMLEKASADAQERRLQEGVLESMRLYPEMEPLRKQVQMATDVAKKGVARLAAVQAPESEHTENSFPELIKRVEETIGYLRDFSPKEIEQCLKQKVIMKLPGMKITFQAPDYINYFVLPNVYFHITSVYNILRVSGVRLNKVDYLGKFPR